MYGTPQASGNETPGQVMYGTAMAGGDWFAVRTASRHEKKVAAQFGERNIRYFLPLATEKRNWSDREKSISTPLFPGYVFVQIIPTPESRLAVLRNTGVAGFVAQGGKPAAIPPEQIEGVRALLDSKRNCVPHAYVSSGQRVRIRGGSMHGVEGVLLAANNGRTLILSIEAIGKSVAIEVHGYQLEPV